MIYGMMFENTPDFEYVFEDTVRLPEFEVYHIGYGLYRFAQPLNYTRKDFSLLQEKYHNLTFFYQSDGAENIKLLFTMSTVCNITSFYFMDNRILRIYGFAKYIPIGYYAQDKRVERSTHYDRESGAADSPDGLLGFQWTPGLYYDRYGRQRYVRIGGSVAKLIATGVYAFQKIPGNETDQARRDRYPCIAETICAKEFKGFNRCAVMGPKEFDGGSISFYKGTQARYIAFDDIGITLLKQLYEYTIGYEYKEIEVVTKEEEAAYQNKIKEFITSPKPVDWEERNRRGEECKNSFQNQIGPRAVELVKGCGYRDITVYYRILFHKDRKTNFNPEKYDFAYIEDGILKLFNVFWDGINSSHSVPVRVLAELYVIRKMELCQGVTDNILIKVIDNTGYEKGAIGADNYENFMKFIEYH